MVIERIYMMSYKTLSRERKDLQAKGLLPDFYTTGGYQLLKNNYLWAETPLAQYQAIAKSASIHVEGKMPLPMGCTYKTWYEAFFDLLWKGWLSPSSPVLSNMGNPLRGMPVSCSGQFISDSIDGFYTNLHESAVLSKNGFGTSAYVGAVRPRGAAMMNNTGKASGVMPVIDMFAQMANDVSQGCYDKDTEVLTENGFITFEQLISLKENDTILRVAQVTDSNDVEFVEPLDYIKYIHNGEMIKVKDRNIDLLLTPNHNMVYKRQERVSTKKDANGKYISNEKYVNDNWLVKPIEEMKFYRDIYMYHSASKKDGEKELSNWERFLIAYQADGSPTKNCATAARFRLKKVRKYERLISILKNLDLSYSERVNKDNVYEIYVNTQRDLPKTFSWVEQKISTVSSDWCEAFLVEVSNWDSSIVRNDDKTFSFRYSSIHKINVDMLSAIASICGYRQNVEIVTNREGNRQDIWQAYFSSGNKFGCEKLTMEKEYYSDYAYCIEVPSHKLIVRRNGKTIVCGNSNRRGSIALYMEINHDDFYEVINKLEQNPKKYNIGWNITDAFIEKLNNRDVDAINRFQETLRVKMITGKGYYFFVDKVNRMLPAMWKDNDKFVVKASNLCFTGDTMVAVADGRRAVSIRELAEHSNGVGQFKVYSSRPTDREWINEIKTAIAFKTGSNKEVVKITLSNGSSFKCTPDHELALTEAGRYIEARKSLGVLLQGYGNKSLGVRVVSVEAAGYEDVYDLTVEDNHNFNIITSTEDSEYLQCSGVLVHNCTEISLYANEEESFTCVLSSMNLAKYDEWKDTSAVYVATVFLDCVASEFIRQAKSKNILQKAVQFTENNRALGLGLLGFASYLSKNMIPFEDLRAHFINIEIAKLLKKESHRASEDMAKHLGEPLNCVGHGRRNTHTLAIAPTKSTALLLGGASESISPHISMTFTQITPAGEVERINPELVALMKSKNIFSKKHIQEIIEKKGSVQEVSWLTEEEKLVFRTAFEINQEVLIRYASMRQRYIDQGQSINLFFAGNADEQEIARIHKLAFEDPYILSLYYVYSRKDTVVAKQSECLACM